MLWLQGWPPAIRLWHPQQQQLRWLTPTRHHESRVNPYWPALVQRSSTSTQCNPWSRVCAVAQYAVLEANGKVNGIGEISNPSPSQTLDQFGCRFKYITTSPRESMCKIWLKSIKPLPPCACVKKRGFAWVFFVYISVYLSIRSSSRLQATFLARF